MFILLFLIVSAIGLVVVYEDEVKAVVIKELNKHLATEVRIEPKNIDLTFISSFPKCAIEFKNFTAMEAWDKKEKDTLMFAENLSLRFSLQDIFNKKYDVKQIALTNARLYLKADKNGKPNYEVWKTKELSTTENSNDSLQFKLESIELKNINISYKNRQQKFKTECIINDVVFTGNFSDHEYEMTSEGKIKVNSVSVDKTSFIKNKLLNLDIVFQVTGDKYTIKKADLALNKMEFDLDGNFKYSDSLENFKLNYKARNMDIESVLSLLPEKYKDRISDYKSTGEFFANGNFEYDVAKPFSIRSSFGINKATIEYAPKGTKLTNVVVNGELVVSEKNSYIKWSDFNVDLNGDNVKGRFLMENFGDPYLEVAAVGAFNLMHLHSFWPIDTLQKLEGNMKFSGEIKGKFNDLKQNTFSDKLSVNLNVEVEKLKTQFKNDPKEIAVESCKIIAVERDIKVENFKLLKGETDLELNGEIPGLFNHLLDNKSPLVIKGNLNCKNLSMEDLIFSSGSSGSSASESSEFNVPDNVNLVLDATIQHFTFGKFEANNIRGNFELKNQKAMVSDMKFETMEGEAVVNAFADASGKNLDLTLQSQIKNINVKKMFTQMNNFGQATLLDKNINGYITATIDFFGTWDKQLNVNLNSITTTADMTIDRGELNDFKPLEGLARFVDLQELRRIKFSSLTSKIQIKNSTIFIPQTTIKNSVLNIDFNGTHTFSNDVDYHIRLLISELLAKKRKADDEFGPEENDPDNRRSAFILMTGNIDNLQYKYDRKGLKQKIKEDIKQEKQNLKDLFREEFGSKKDTAKVKPGAKANQKFELEKPDNKQEKKTLEPKKKKDDDDDF
jgi:hypothetical protein